MKTACRIAVAVALTILTLHAGGGDAGAQGRFRNIYDGISVRSSYSVLSVVETDAGAFAASGGDGAVAFLIELDGVGGTNFFKTYDIFSAPGFDALAGGGYVLAGEHLSSDDPTILRLDASGDPLWATSYDLGYAEQGFYAVHPTPDGGYLASGIMTVKVDAVGVVEWSKIHIGGGGNVNGTAITADGGSVLTGEGQYGNTADDYNAVVTRFDAGGSVVWNRVYGGDGYDWAAGVAETIDGGFVVTGWTRSFGDRACFLIRLDPDGALLWANTYPGTGDSDCRSVIESSGGYVLTGALDGDLLLLRTDLSGAVDWARTYPGSSVGYAVRATRDGGYVVAGVSGAALTVIKTDDAGDADTCDQTAAVVVAVAAPFLTGNNTTDGPQTWTPTSLTPNASVPLPPVPRVCASCSAVASAQVSATEICAGESVTLTAVGSMVTDCNVAGEYRWTAPGFLRDWSTTPDATDSPVDSTSYTLEVRCADPGCQAATAPLDVLVDIPSPPPDVGNTQRVVKDVSIGPPAPDSLVFSWLEVGGSADRYNLRSSDNRDFSPPNDIRTTVAPGAPARLLGELPLGPSLRLYRVTTGNCAGDESPYL